MGVLGYVLGQRKNRAMEGLLLAFLLGLIGLVILACLKPKQAAPAQTWGGVGTYGAPATHAYAPQASYGYGQANVLPAATGSASPVIPANPYAPLAETMGYGYEQPVPVASPTPAASLAQTAPAASTVPAPSTAPVVPAQWFADPSGRHQHRWWDGNVWTEHVADNGVVSVDTPLPAQPS
jgi:hypothetical protein